MAAKEGWQKWFRRDNLLILILSGVLLFIVAMPTTSSTEKKEEVREEQTASVLRQQENGSEDFASDLEAQLEEVLGEMAGVGRVKVMITLKSSEERVVEKDEPVSRTSTNESDSAGGNRNITQLENGSSTVYSNSGSDSEPYVIKTLSPRVEGVVVVAQGAGEGMLNQSITEMVQALFGVEAHKVKVVKMASVN